jgi:hypothetical protein
MDRQEYNTLLDAVRNTLVNLDGIALFGSDEDLIQTELHQDLTNNATNLQTYVSQFVSEPPPANN